MTSRRCVLSVAAVALVMGLSTTARADTALSLDQAYRLALRNNPGVRILRERVHQAEAVRYRAWSAFKPTANFQGSYTHYDKEIAVDFSELANDLLRRLGMDPMPSQPTVIQKQDQFAFALAGNLPLIHGAAFPRLKMARKGVESAELQEIRSQQDFLMRVAAAYYLVVSRQDAVRALENKLAVDQKHLAAARARFEVGQAPRAEVLRADLVATQDEQSLRAQRNAFHAARRQLGILVGLPGSIDVTRPVEPAAPGGSEQSMIDRAFADRLDLRATGLAIEIARHAKNAVWWNFAPSLDLSAAYRWSESAGFAGEKGSWYLMLTLNAPIYDAGLRYADLRETQSRIIEAREQRRALEQSIESDLVRLRSELESAVAGVVSARKALSLAKTTAEDMEASFEAGAATQLDVLDASQRLLDAELQLTTSLFTRDLAVLALAHAQGQFNPLRGGK